MSSIARIKYLAVVLFFCLSMGAAWSQAGPISGIRFSHDVFQKGTRGIAVYFDLDLRSLMLDSSLSVVATISDKEGQPTMATPDAKAYQGPDGILRDSISLFAVRSNPVQRQIGIFFPYYAMSLRMGEHERFLGLHLVNKRSGTVEYKSVPTAFTIKMPQRRMHRIHMTNLETLETDINGETWDLVVLSAREIYPELEWAIYRGNVPIFRSERVRNSLRHDVEPAKNVSPLFGLAVGDSITLRVEDFDFMSSSDLIGAKKFTPHSVGRPLDLKFQGAFGRVRHCDFYMEETVLPPFQLQEFSVEPKSVYQGVTGYTCRVKYLVEPYPQDGKLRIGVEAPGSGLNPLAKFVRMIQGPALFGPDHYLTLHEATGDLRFFIPWYAFESQDIDMLRLDTEVQFGNGNRYPIGWFTEKWTLEPSSIQDFNFGKQRIYPDTLLGVHGLRIRSDYMVSGNYFEDLPHSMIELRPAFLGPSGPIAFENMSVAQANGSFAKMREVIGIQHNNDTGQVDLFLPYWVLNHQGRENLRIAFAAMLLNERDQTIMGTNAHEIEVDIPGRTDYEFQVKDLKCKRELLPETGMGIWWRVSVGHQVMYSSRIIRNTAHPQWRNQESAKLYLVEGDKFRLEIFRETQQGKIVLLDDWKGTIQDLPTAGGKAGSLKFTNVKRLNFKFTIE